MQDNRVKLELEIREIEKVRDAVEQAVLQPEDLGEGIEKDQHSYLRLVMSAKVAYDESNRILQQSVNQARRTGHSWTVLGKVLSISRQAAQQRFGSQRFGNREDGGETGEFEHQRVIKGATAFNEMQLLRVEGAAGNHLVSFGPLFLVVQSSDCQWEHMRLTALRMNQARWQLESKGWTYVGSWFPFHYFKRPIESS